MIRNMSMKAKLALGFLVIAILPMVALGFILFQDIKSEMLSSTERNILSVLKSLEREMNSFISHNLDYITFISNMTNIRDFAARLLNGGPEEEARQELQDIYLEAILSNKEIEVMFLLHPETGEVLSSSMPYHEGMFLNKRPYFALGKKGPVLYPVHYSLALEKNILAFAAPVIREDDLLGVLVFWIRTDELNNIARTSPPVKSSLVTRSNIHIMGAGTGRGYTSFVSGVFSLGAERALAGHTGSGIYTDADGVEVVGSYTLLEGLDTALLVEIPLVDILESTNLKGMRFLIITLGFALIIIIIAFIIGNHITNPIMCLARSIRKFGEGGKTDQLVTVKGGAEVTALTTAFNTMISKRRAAEADLEKSKSMLSEAQHIAHIGNWEHDVLSDRLWWSEEIYNIFGLDPDNVKLSIHTFLQSVYPDDRKNLENEIKSGKPHRTDYRIVRPNGEIRFIHEEVRTTEDADGRPLMVWGTAQDITDLKMAEKEMHEARKRAEAEKAKSDAIVAGIGDGISIQDTNFKILYQNKVHKDWIGGHDGEYCYRAYEKNESICPGCPVQMSFQDGRIHIAERYTQTSDELYYFEITASPLRDPTGEIIAGIEVVRNITDRKKADQKLESLNRDLSQKNKELEQVLYVTSHDLRSPLVNIDGFGKELELSLKDLSDILKNDGVSHDVQAKIASIVEKDIPESMGYIRLSTKKMDLLLAGLLRLSRVGRTELNKVRLNMNEVMSDIVSNFEFNLQQSGSRIEVLKLPPCIGDAVHIDRVFSNLIDNAIKYFDNERPGIIRVSGYSEGEESVYCVEDNGIGIVTGYHGKIFEMFQRLEPDRYAGEGLGLTIVHRIVEMHRGRIWVESEKGKGSKFFISLPSRVIK